MSLNKQLVVWMLFNCLWIHSANTNHAGNDVLWTSGSCQKSQVQDIFMYAIPQGTVNKASVYTTWKPIQEEPRAVPVEALWVDISWACVVEARPGKIWHRRFCHPKVLPATKVRRKDTRPIDGEAQADNMIEIVMAATLAPLWELFQCCAMWLLRTTPLTAIGGHFCFPPRKFRECAIHQAKKESWYEMLDVWGISMTVKKF